eukprot:3039884-Pyramimonas_sp.AAC.1
MAPPWFPHGSLMAPSWLPHVSPHGSLMPLRDSLMYPFAEFAHSAKFVCFNITPWIPIHKM